MIDREIATAEYHTGGEPYRIVTGGVDTPIGDTVLDRRAWAEANLDEIRALLINEPRGHADMYGCFVTPPDPDECRRGTGAFGMVFFHKDGFSTACGHGTIAGATWAIESGLVAPVEPVTELWIDVPSGRLRVDADVVAGRVGEVRFENVASYVTALDLPVATPLGQFVVDVSYGGAFYASADVTRLGLGLTPEHLPALNEAGRTIKWAIDEHAATRHPVDDRLGGCYGTIWFERLGTGADGSVRQRNVTIFADGEVDRRGELARGSMLEHTSIIGSRFSGRVLGDGPVTGGLPTVRTEIGGRAHRTGTASFILDPDDDLGLGFQLR